MVYFIKCIANGKRWEVSPVENPTPEIMANLENTWFDGVKKNECYIDMKDGALRGNMGMALNWAEYFIMR